MPKRVKIISDEKVIEILKEHPFLHDVARKHHVGIKRLRALARAANILILLCLVIGAVSAYTIENVSITPDTIVQGDDVTVSFLLNLTGGDIESGHYTFNPGHAIVMGTILENAQWERSTVIDGQASKPFIFAYGSQARIIGTDLAYPLGTFEKVKISLTGKGPTLQTSSRGSVLMVTEINSASIAMDGSTIDYQRTIIQKGDLKQAIYLAEQDLNTLNAHIEKTRQKGIDTSSAKEIYDDAKQMIDFCKTLPENEYETGLAELENVRRSIMLSEESLGRAYVQIEINKALVPFKETKEIITWFEGNNSTKTYPGLTNLKANYTIADNAIKQASGSMKSNDFDNAYDQAIIAYQNANMTYHEALVLQEKAQDPLSPAKDNAIWIIIGFGCLCLILMCWPKKKKPVLRENIEPGEFDGTEKVNHEE